MRLRLMCSLLVALAVPLLLAVSEAADDRTRTFNAPADRVWTVTRSTLTSLGWKIDKEDRDAGWLVTWISSAALAAELESRGLDHENFGVYAKGTKHRLRVVIKGRDAARTEVSVERRVFTEERILFVDKEEDILTTARSVEKKLLDEVARHL